MKITKRKRGPSAASAERKVKAVSERSALAATPAQREAVPVEAAAAGIVLASNCSVKDAAALKSSLCGLADESGDVTVDASGVERVDTATMQLLCAFVRARAAQERKVVWLGNSKVLQEAARLLGIQKLLALPETELTGAAA